MWHPCLQCTGFLFIGLLRGGDGTAESIPRVEGDGEVHIAVQTPWTPAFEIATSLSLSFQRMVGQFLMFPF